MPLIYNSGHEPLVPGDRWGEGVVNPGDSIDVENPEAYTPPWTDDPERAASAARAWAGPTGAVFPSIPPNVTEPSDVAPEAPSEPHVAPEAPEDGPPVHVEPNGDVATDSGQIIGHVEPQPSAIADVDPSAVAGDSPPAVAGEAPAQPAPGEQPTQEVH